MFLKLEPFAFQLLQLLAAFDLVMAKASRVGAVMVVDDELARDRIEVLQAAGRQAKEKLTAKSVEPGKYDLVLSPALALSTNSFLSASVNKNAEFA